MKTYHTRRNTEPYQTMEYQNELRKNPHIEVLYSDPPQLRVNGKIIPWPQGKTPEELDAYVRKQLSEREPYYLKAQHIQEISPLYNLGKINEITEQIINKLNITQRQK